MAVRLCMLPHESKLQREDYCVVSDVLYSEMMKKVISMKPNKRKNSKDKLSDEKGADSRVRWIEGKLMYYSLRSHQFVPIRSMSNLRSDSLFAGYAHGTDKQLKDLKQMSESSVTLTAEQHHDFMDNIMMSKIYNNYTGNGNHCRNKIVVKTDRKSSLAF